MILILFGAVVLGALVLLSMISAAMFRVVVPTNDVHIVQSGKKTVSYGKDQPGKNVYYKWPSWWPLIGVRAIILPVSNFTIRLDNYPAYDKGRLPFIIDIMAFFRIENSDMAAQRVSSHQELEGQLQGILQGACRAILASSEIEEILEGRSKFGEMFTKEVDHNLAAWGVQTVKMIELMDIRDVQGSQVIQNIMAKKKSFIERESRVQVAENKRAAEIAEIEAQQAVDVRGQEALQLIGQRTAEKEKAVGIALQQSQQEIKMQEKVTAEKTMAVKQVEAVRAAEIQREVMLVNVDQEKKIAITRAEGEKSKTVTMAEGQLAQAKLHAEGIEAEGKAKGAAMQAELMAPIETQIALAKEIGANENYQTYLIKIRTVEKDQAVGVEQAKALIAADVKIIANTGDAVEGVGKVMDLFTSKGATQLAGALEAINNSPTASKLLRNLGGDKDKPTGK